MITISDSLSTDPASTGMQCAHPGMSPSSSAGCASPPVVVGS